MPRPSNTEERQAQITGALMKVMAKRGYDGASVADIAKAARLTPGLVHYHFKSKQEILLAALRDLVARHDANLEVKRKLGFSGEQKFSRSMIDAVAQVASTSLGDDCGEGFAPPSAWAGAFALMQSVGPQVRD